MNAGPSTVLKALSLIDFFNERRPTIGLSEFSKLSGYHKATTQRFLSALEVKGFVEQDQVSREYLLGPAFLRFSHLREASFPLTEAVNTVLRDLKDATEETAHASLIAGELLANIGVVQSNQINRIIIEPGESLPLHATASGLAYLAFSSPDTVKKALDQELEMHTEGTIINPDEISKMLELIRKTGAAYSDGTYCDDVLGIAAPYFGPNGKVCGAVAISLPTSRATTERKAFIEEQVKAAAQRLTALRGGSSPDQFPS
ncbi:IclR family transcriptional regulator [Neptunicoccus cionae]|uniref:IclR family transcriptional regulator n=1 Tax=Neptunicoccus cionae TaxID=2035344 RepID=UPI000C77C125|nr:IclR family transcriptional regulator [Amylibacter cionae]PLS21008.1 IclR family transcriptional regulator [Amylibacter cionae]